MKEIKTKFIVLNKRRYGQPKLKKPKELREIQKAFSVGFIKCQCQCFIKANDLYVKHRDFESIEVIDSKKEYYGKMFNVDFDKIQKREKLIYKNNFGSIVLRGEAWLKLENFMLDVNNIPQSALSFNLFMQAVGIDGNLVWNRFFEEIIKKTKK